ATSAEARWLARTPLRRRARHAGQSAPSRKSDVATNRIHRARTSQASETSEVRSRKRREPSRRLHSSAAAFPGRCYVCAPMSEATDNVVSPRRPGFVHAMWQKYGLIVVGNIVFFALLYFVQYRPNSIDNRATELLTM